MKKTTSFSLLLLFLSLLTMVTFFSKPLYKGFIERDLIGKVAKVVSGGEGNKEGILVDGHRLDLSKINLPKGAKRLALTKDLNGIIGVYLPQMTEEVSLPPQFLFVRKENGELAITGTLNPEGHLLGALKRARVSTESVKRDAEVRFVEDEELASNLIYEVRSNPLPSQVQLTADQSYIVSGKSYQLMQDTISNLIANSEAKGVNKLLVQESPRESQMIYLFKKKEEIVMEGRVGSETLKAQIEAAIKTQNPSMRVLNELQMQPDLEKASWMGYAMKFSPCFLANTKEGALIQYKNKGVTVKGEFTDKGAYEKMIQSFAILSEEVPVNHFLTMSESEVSPEEVKPIVVKKVKLVEQKEMKQLKSDLSDINDFSIYFETSSDVVSPAFEKKIKKITQAILRSKANISQIKKIELKGYADSRGSQEANKKLSKKRALSTKKKLLEGGIPSDLIKYQFFGSDPAASNQLSKNRRVDIFIKL